MPRERFQLFVKQHDRTMRIQERAEAVQARSAQLVNRIHRFVPLTLAAVIVLIAYHTWLLVRLRAF